VILVVPVEPVVPCPLTVGAVVTVPLGDWAGFDAVVFGMVVRDGPDGVRFESPLSAARSASRAGGVAFGDRVIGVAFERPADDSGVCEFAAFELGLEAGRPGSELNPPITPRASAISQAASMARSAAVAARTRRWRHGPCAAKTVA
jgi:hypothetical protein